MLLLLPPSEGKNIGGDGPSLRTLLDGPSHPLSAARRSVADALIELATGPPAAAAAALLLPAGVRDDALTANRAMLDSPTMPALERYSGVVYDGLAAATLPPGAKAAALRHILVFSGLLGIVRGNEPVPWYRVPAKAAMPRMGIASTYWRAVLGPVMTAALDAEPDGLVVDLRSSDYAAMWRPAAGEAQRVAAVRVLTERADGSRAVVSFDSKLAKGRLAQALVRRQARARSALTVRDVIAAWAIVEPAGSADVRSGPGGPQIDLIRPSTVLSPPAARPAGPRAGSR
ncbi:MAG: hypothetical protein JWN20_698 [Jatrophihabitantaceae bacterium]|nr:hypothetical protein [Jatrophihabitantaceae bacterium]